MVRSGTESLSSHDPQKRVIIGVNRMSLTVILLNVTVGTFVWLVTGKISILFGVTVETSALALPLVLNRYRKYNGAAMSIYLTMSVATLYFGCALGKAIESQLMITYLIGVSLFMFSRRIYKAVCILSSFLILICLELNSKYEVIAPIRMNVFTQVAVRWSAYLAIIILVIITFHLYWKNDRALRKELQKYADQVKENLEKETREHKNKDKFITNAGHEIKVSFHSIFAIISILENDLKRNGDINKTIKVINDLKAACKISQSINDNIMQFEKYNAGIPTIPRDQLFNPKILFESIVDLYKYVAIRNKIEIECVILDMPKHIRSDDVMIRHILSNLLHNAIKYAPNNSVVLVTCKIKNDILVFSVKDSGEGIPKSVDIFGAYVSQNPDGLGIGLFLVKELVTNLEGKIAVESDENGTIFTVSIPLHPIKCNKSAVLPQSNLS